MRGTTRRRARRALAKIGLASALAMSALAMAGCMTGPHNGTAVGGNVAGKSLTFQGYADEPSYTVQIQVLKEPKLNPSTTSNWVTIATTQTGTEPALYADTPDPLYAWSVSAVPVPVNNATAALRWPQGGLVRLRAVHPDPDGNRILTTFDQVTFNECAVTQPSWQAVGTACQGLGVNNSVVASTTNVPVPPGNAAAFSPSGFLGRKGEISPAETDQYYAATGAPATLAAFKTKYGFPGNEITATYYNDGDLGLGREMHCKSFITASAQVGVACYVTNYSGAVDGAGKGIAAFDVNPTTVLADAVSRQHAFATVAMAFEPTFAANTVKFVVYDADGDRANTAQLDSTANNVSIPNNCLACHGVSSSYNSVTNSVSADARFLPFDPFSFKFSTAAGFTFADQADAIRRLNQLIKITNTSPAIVEFIDGLYAPEGVASAAATAKNTFVPADWANATEGLDGAALYRGVVKPACRTCHMSANSGLLDFADHADFTAQAALIRADACAAHVMPHAERVLKNFWQSGARAYLVTGLPPAAFPDELQACKP
jgi:hypothetical protein